MADATEDGRKMSAWTCDICGYEFYSFKGLRMHVAKHPRMGTA